jgi:hypothetical protein
MSDCRHSLVRLRHSHSRYGTSCFAIRLPLSALLLLFAAVAACQSAVADISCGTTSAADPAPDEISYFGESVSSLSQFPRTSAWGVSYRKIVAPCFALSLAYLNDGHFPGHYRDGVTGEAWLPLNLFSQHLTVSAGLGPFYYNDTTEGAKPTDYADVHGWALLYSLDAVYQFRGDKTGPFVEIRLDHTAPAKSIETTSIGLGVGWRSISDSDQRPEPISSNDFGANEVAAYYWKTVVSSYSSQSARAEEVEYRRLIWDELRASVGFLNEGDAQLIRRNGFIGEIWAEPSFNSDSWSIGAGFGGYAAIDKYTPSAGRHVAGVVSATLSARPLQHWGLYGLDVRFLWHRIVTNYNRDTDILLFGLGYRF